MNRQVEIRTYRPVSLPVEVTARDVELGLYVSATDQIEERARKKALHALATRIKAALSASVEHGKSQA